jgi:hypothetical protein
MLFKLYTNIVTAKKIYEKPVIMSSGGKFICFRGWCSLRFSLAQRLGSARARGNERFSIRSRKNAVNDKGNERFDLEYLQLSGLLHRKEL